MNLRGTWVHALDAECGWRMLCQHVTLFGGLQTRPTGAPSAGDGVLSITMSQSSLTNFTSSGKLGVRWSSIKKTIENLYEGGALTCQLISTG